MRAHSSAPEIDRLVDKIRDSSECMKRIPCRWLEVFAMGISK